LVDEPGVHELAIGAEQRDRGQDDPERPAHREPVVSRIHWMNLRYHARCCCSVSRRRAISREARASSACASASASAAVSPDPTMNDSPRILGFRGTDGSFSITQTWHCWSTSSYVMAIWM